ncbi:MAG: 1-acyl-sn-glycerol-3-phosphate acyltransferase [Pseudomonadales bacterium]
MSTTTSNAGRSAYTRERPVISYVEPNDPCLKAIYMRVMERLLGSQEMQRIYDELKRTPFELKHFIADALCLASINVERSGEIETVISDQGPVVFVANHRFGIVDGAVLCDLATRTRGTFGIIIYSVLCQDKDLVLYFLPIEFESNRAAVRNHVNTRRRARKMLDERGTVLIFPSGMVSTATTRASFGQVTEFPWSTYVRKLLEASKATVVPVYFLVKTAVCFISRVG